MADRIRDRRFVKSSTFGGKKMHLAGTDQVVRNLRKVQRRMKRNLPAAMTEVVITVQRESMKRTPVKTGNLQNSHRSKVDKTLGKVIGQVYVLAAYALYVHEAPPSTVFRSNWPRGRKFLERAITDNLKQLKRIIKRHLKPRKR